MACCALLSTAGEGLLHRVLLPPAARTQECRALLFLLRTCYTHLPAAGPLLPEQGVLLAAALLAAALRQHWRFSPLRCAPAAVLERGCALQGCSARAMSQCTALQCRDDGLQGTRKTRGSKQQPRCCCTAAKYTSSLQCTSLIATGHPATLCRVSGSMAYCTPTESGHLLWPNLLATGHPATLCRVSGSVAYCTLTESDHLLWPDLSSHKCI